MSALRWTLLAVAILVAMVAASMTAAPSDWQQVEQWARARRAQLTAEASTCPVLAGEPHPSDRAAAYQRAMRLVAALPSACRTRLQALREDPQAGPPTAADRLVLASLVPAVLALDEAVRATGGAWPTTVAIDDLFGLWAILDAVLVGGRAGGAWSVPAVLMVLACGLDHVGAGELLQQVAGLRIAELALEACDDAWLAAVPSGDLGRLAKALAAADLALPVVSEVPALVAVQLAEFLAAHETVEPMDLGMNSPLGAWRHGFSVRRSGMARTSQLVADVHAFEAATPPAEAWSARQVRLARLVARDRANNADIFMPFLHMALEVEEGRRRTSGKLRLLRLAVAAAAGQALPELADPLGEGPLRIEGEGPARLARSAAGGLQRALPPARR